MISEPLATIAPAVPRSEDAVEAFQRLIQTCYAGEHDFRTAASVVEDDVLRRLFNSYSLQRARFAAELQTELARWKGVDFARSQPPGANRNRAYARSEDALTACCNHDEILLERYEEALSVTLPRSARFLVSAQFALARQAHDRIKSICARQLESQS
jgi:uncharacterized protein (TIGR02284 family)